MSTKQLKDLGVAHAVIQAIGPELLFMSAEEKDAALSAYALSAAQKDLVLSLTATAGAEGAATGTTIGLGAAFKALWGSIVPFLPYIVAGAVAVGALIGAIALARNSDPSVQFEKASKAAAEASSKVEELTSQYDTNKERIEELNALKTSGDISSAQEAELANLEAENALLETQIALYTDLYNKKSGEARNAARKRAAEFLDAQNDPGVFGIDDVLTNYTNAKSNYEKAARDAASRGKTTSAAMRSYGRAMETWGNQLNDLLTEYSELRSALDPSYDADLISALDEKIINVKIALGLDYEGKSDGRGIDRFKEEIKSLDSDIIGYLKNGGTFTGDMKKRFQDWITQAGYTEEAFLSYFQQVQDSVDETGNVLEQTTSDQINDLTSLRDELSQTTEALETYKKALEGGEKGDSASQLADIYKAAIEDINAGKLDTRNLHAAADLFFSPDWLASHDFDLSAVGEALSSGIWKAVFTSEGDYGVAFANYIKDNLSGLEDVFDIIDNHDGTFQFAYSSIDDIAKATGMSTEAISALLDALDAFGVQVMMSKEDMQNLVDSLDFSSGIEGVIEQLYRGKHDAFEIVSIMQQLGEAGVIDLTGVQSLGELVQGVIGNIGDLDQENANPEVTADTSQAVGAIDDVANRLSSLIGGSPYTLEVEVATTGELPGGLPNSKSSSKGKTGGGGSWTKPTLHSSASGTRNAPGGPTLLAEGDGPELVSDNGHVELITEPSIRYLHKGATVLNADETRKVMRKSYGNVPKIGYKTGTRNSIVVLNDGGGGRTWSPNAYQVVPPQDGVGTQQQTGDGSSKADDDKNKERIDWIETAIKRIESAIDKLKDTASSAYKTVQEKLEATQKAIGLVTQELEIQEAAYARYMREADDVGLADDLKALVQNGEIDIAGYDSETAKLIKDYQSWYEKAMACSDAIGTLHENLSSLYSDIFDIIGKGFDNELELLEHEEALWEDMLEDYHSHGIKEVKSYYGEMKKISNVSLDLLIEKYKQMNAALQEALDTGVIKEGDQAWYDMRNTINGVAEDILSMRKELVSMFEEAYEKIQAIYEIRQELLQTSATGYENDLNRYRNVSSADRFSTAARLTTNSNLQVAAKERELAALRDELENSGLDELSDKFREYQAKINQLINEIQSLKNDGAAIYEELFKGTSEDIDRTIEAYSNSADDIKAQLETYTDVESDEFNNAYNNLRTNQLALVEDLGTHLKQLISIRDQAVDSGKIEEGSVAYIEMSNAIREYEIKLRDAQLAVSGLYTAQFDQVAASYENMASLQSEADSVATLRAEYEALFQIMSTGVSSGSIAEGSEAWYAMQLKLNDLQSKIADTTSSMAGAASDAANKARKNAWDKFDFIEKRIGDLTAEAEFLLDLLENNDLFSENGSITDSGMASVALHSYIYETYMQLARDYAAEAENISKQLANNPSDSELLERREELLKLQRDSILSAQDEKDAIVDLVKDGIDLELDSLKDLVDAYEQNLDSAKSLYEYQRKITDQTSKIATLQKQLAAYSGDTSEESRSRIQRIQVELAEAQQDLADTEYEQRLSDQKDILDNLYDEYETTLNERLDNVDSLISEMSDIVSANGDAIKNAILDAADKAEYTITGPMSSLVSFGTSIGTVLDSIREIAGRVILGDGSSKGSSYTPSIIAADQISIEQQRIDSATSYLEQFVEQGSLLAEQMDEVLTTLGQANEDSVHNTEQLILQWVENGNMLETQGNAIFAAIHQGMDQYQTLAEMLAEKQAELAAIEAQNRVEAAERVMEEFANQGILSEEQLAKIVETLSEGQDDDIDHAVEMISQLVKNGEIDEETAVAIANALGVSAETLSARIESLEAAESETGVGIDEAASGIENTVNNAATGIIHAIDFGSKTVAEAVGGVTGNVEHYDTGGVVRYTGLAQLDGTPSRPELVLNQAESQNFLDLKDVLAKMASQPLSILNGGSGGSVPVVSGLRDLSGVAERVVNAASPRAVVSNSIGDINIQIEHVDDYNDFCYKLQHDKTFEKMIQDMTIGQIGANELSKFKYRFKK